MNKNELVTAMAETAGMSKKDTEKALNAFTVTVADALKKGDKVQLVGFGCFDVAKRKERKGFNPRTKAPVTIEASKQPRFKAGASLKETVNSGK